MKIEVAPHREIIQIGPHESFLVFDRVKDEFDYPIHFHPEFELNYISGGSGLRRVVADSLEEIRDKELVLIGPNIPHCWEQYQCDNTSIREITLQFHDNLFDTNLLQKAIMKPINRMLEKSKNGVVFSKETCIAMEPRLDNLSKLDGIDYFLEIISVLYDLSISRNQRILSISGRKNSIENDARLDNLYNFIHKNYERKISLDEVAEHVNMSKVSLNRFVKRSTGKTFVEYLNDVRIGYASRWLIEKNDNISQIAFNCGFNTMANFNRMFKKSKGCTPSQYKQEFLGIKRVL